MAKDNPAWGRERIAAELLIKPGIQVSPCTIRKYLPEDSNSCRRRTVPTQQWMNFVRNHAKTMLACDFFVSVAALFLSS
jgi:putative transposase